ncbi:unnamed protein product [Linum trigynum]|uniref:Uncharacterized protein n=1 Tax=Linum trigynum TaxID=586398 RepID=A0AAV2G067_9ROSI
MKWIKDRKKEPVTLQVPFRFPLRTVQQSPVVHHLARRHLLLARRRPSRPTLSTPRAPLAAAGSHYFFGSLHLLKRPPFLRLTSSSPGRNPVLLNDDYWEEDAMTYNSFN